MDIRQQELANRLEELKRYQQEQENILQVSFLIVSKQQVNKQNLILEQTGYSASTSYPRADSNV